MNTVKDALAQKSGALIHVRSGDMVVRGFVTGFTIENMAATIIEGRRHKKEPQAEYALGVGRSLLPHT